MISCIVTCHKYPGPETIINILKNQTYKNIEILVFWSCGDLKVEEELIKNNVHYYGVNNFNDWGHEKRSTGIDYCTGEYIGFFNSDDFYKKYYLQFMIDSIGDKDLVFCDWTENKQVEVKSYPAPTMITSGNFIVKSNVAKKLGWNSRKYEADWEFIKSVIDNGYSIVKAVGGIPYFHVSSNIIYHPGVDKWIGSGFDIDDNIILPAIKKRKVTVF